MTKSTAGVFDSIRRFHIYDHNHDKWVMSGAAFEDVAVIDHRYDDELQEFRNPELIVSGEDNLQMVWEDPAQDGEYESCHIDDEVAGEIAESAAAAVAAEIDVPPEQVRVAQIDAPDKVEFVCLTEADDE